MNLLSDAAQSETWPAIKPQLTKGKVSSITYLVVAKLIGYAVDTLLFPRVFTCLQRLDECRCTK